MKELHLRKEPRVLHQLEKSSGSSLTVEIRFPGTPTSSHFSHPGLSASQEEQDLECPSHDPHSSPAGLGVHLAFLAAAIIVFILFALSINFFLQMLI
jgi:hypothetical protein